MIWRDESLTEKEWQAMKFLCVGEGHRLVEHPWADGVMTCRECHKGFYQVAIFNWSDE